MKNIKNIFCGLFVSFMVVADVWAVTTARTATVPERGRAAATVAQRPKQRVEVSKRSAASIVRASRGNVVSRTAASEGKRIGVGDTLSRATNIIGDAGRALMRRAFGAGRVAVTPGRTVARVATNAGTPARAAKSVVKSSGARARATAVFGDISKLGEGYNKCREAYSTCMDQFCAAANDTYRRCFCSDTFRTLRDKEEALDAAAAMLANFENNNLNAVDKSAEEVNAMYSATVGEAAIKKDTSASARLLDDISDLLSGKKKAEPENKSMSMLSLDLSFSADIDDVWSSGGDSGSLFGDSGVDLSQMEGTDLYNNAHNQCLKLVSGQCEDAAAKNMVKSAYSIFITQDCNAYQKKLGTKTEQIKTTVRTAEKYLREARLEEYRSHNSSDVNECMDKVEQAMLATTACGPSYEKCLDPTGAYINTSTGDPIYSPRLFMLADIINLDGQSADVLNQNPQFDAFLDSKKIYAKTALDTCRTIADTVWGEYKRNALIKIAQSQDEKIEEVKMSCVSTMKECYDTQGDALKEFDDTTAQAAGALAARASRDMCSDKVLACAALYGSSSENYVACKVDNKGKITNATQCGLRSLLAFVETVDEVRIAEGCETAVKKYLEDLCTPTSGDEGYPWNCRLKVFGNTMVSGGSLWRYVNNPTTIEQLVVNYTYENCGDKGKDTTNLEPRIQREIEQELDNLLAALDLQLGEKCREMEGIWQSVYGNRLGANAPRLTKFYTDVFGGRTDASTVSTGTCFENTTMTACLSYNVEGRDPVAVYNADRDECSFTDQWYEIQCGVLGNAYFEDDVCYTLE